MLSNALTQLYERARIRFAVEIEIFDGSMHPIYPEVETDLDRGVRDSPDVRAALWASLSTARAGQVTVNQHHYDLIPLRRGGSGHTELALAAVRCSTATTELVPEFWAEFVRSTVEADTANLAAMAEERRRSRLLLGTLRFLRHLLHTASEAELADAVIQAAAIWFDADARIYQRDLAGDYGLYAALPGAVVDDGARRLTMPAEAGASDVYHTSASALWNDSRDVDVILAPLGPRDQSSMMLVLIGAKVDGATLPILAEIAGAQLELSRALRRDRVRQHFLELTHHPGESPETTAVQIVRDVITLASAGSARLTLHAKGRSRRFIAIGDGWEGGPVRGELGGWTFAADEFVCALALGADVSATLELRPLAGEAFSPDAAAVTLVATQVFHGWLRAVAPALEAAAGFTDADPAAAFLRRIEEELERARRFDIRLSLVLVDLPPQAAFDVGVVLQETVRRELRMSDVSGPMGAHRVAALLTHTDPLASQAVVERLRRRIAASVSDLGVTGVVVGHAAFSQECGTADALLSTAAREGLPIALV